jgi:hypothetical protein
MLTVMPSARHRSTSPGRLRSMAVDSGMTTTF